MAQHVIDCDAFPMIPKGWEIRPEDQLPGAVGGLLQFDMDDIDIVQAVGDGTATGYEVAKRLGKRRLLKANVLDYFLVHYREMLDFGPRYIFFFGTIYRLPDGCRCVRMLFNNGDPPDSDDYVLMDDDFSNEDWVATIF